MTWQKVRVGNQLLTWKVEERQPICWEDQCRLPHWAAGRATASISSNNVLLQNLDRSNTAFVSVPQEGVSVEWFGYACRLQWVKTGCGSSWDCTRNTLWAATMCTRSSSEMVQLTLPLDLNVKEWAIINFIKLVAAESSWRDSKQSNKTNITNSFNATQCLKPWQRHHFLH